MNKSVDTRRAAVRHLHFDSIHDVLAEIDRLEEAQREGRLRTSGNWTAGQIMTHIAAWIEYGYDGYPLGPPPWFIRWLLRWQGKKYLRRGMPAGVRIPGVEQGTFGMEPLEPLAAAERLRSAFQRLQRGEPAKFHSPAFGKMSHEDRVLLNLRHAELHLGFTHY